MKYTLYIREIVSNRIFESKFEKEEKFRENASIHKETRATFYPNFRIRGQKKKKKKKKMSKPRKLEAEVSFFCFCNGERVSIGNISRGKVGSATKKRPDRHNRATFQPAEFHGNERWSEDDSRRLTRRTSRRVK